MATSQAVSHTGVSYRTSNLCCVFLLVEAVGELGQFGLVEMQFGEAAIQANEKLRKCPDGFGRQSVETGNMNVDLAMKESLVQRLA